MAQGAAFGVALWGFATAAVATKWRDSIAQGAALGKKSIEKSAALKGRNGEQPNKASNGRQTFDSASLWAAPLPIRRAPLGLPTGGRF
ncbi:MAG TPA: hypothetical protein VGN42_11305, partial [Pirellulales bacterium]|nr:hypothetical protein [Pirellulales bacterium]